MLLSKIGGLIFISSFLISSFVLFNNRRRRLNIVWSLFSLSVSLWGLGLFLGFRVDTAESALFWARLYNIPPIFIPIFFLHFVTIIVRGFANRFVYLNYGISGLFLAAALLFPAHFIPDVSPKMSFPFYPNAGPIFIAFSAYFILLAILGTVQLIRFYVQTHNPTIKKQVLYILIGTAIGFVGGSTTFPLVFNLNIYPIGAFFVLIYTLTVAFAITKHDLMDISLIITRFFSYGLVYSGIIASFVMINLFLSGGIQILANIGVGILWGTYADRFRQNLQTAAEKKWVKDYYDQTEVIHQISSALSPVFERDAIIEGAADSIKQIVEVKHITIITAQYTQDGILDHYRVFKLGTDKESRLAVDHPMMQLFRTIHTPTLYKTLLSQYHVDYSDVGLSKFDILLPLHSPGELEGIIIMGQRLSEAAYSAKDMQLFATILNVINVFLDRMRPYEKIQRDFNLNQKKLFDMERSYARSEKIASMANLIQEYNHEIKTPLSIIQAELEDSDYNWGDALLAPRNEMLKQVKRAVDIVETTLRLSSNNQDITRHEVVLDIHDVIDRTLDYFPISGAALSLIKGDIPSIKGVPDDLQMVFINLFKNAVEAMPDGGKLTIHTSVSDLDGYVTIRISDTGIGIEKEKIETIWEPFVSRHVTKGRGLGLSTVFRIVREHLGYVHVESTPGKGATFILQFPPVSSGSAFDTTTDKTS